MKVVLHGVRGSMPAAGADFVRIGGHTSCVSVTLRGGPAPVLVLDAGTGLTNLTAWLQDAAFEGEILLSHLHWDHVQGLPFFGSGDNDAADVVLRLPAQDGAVVGSPGSAEELLSRAMSPPHFPIGPDGLRGRWRFEASDAGWAEVCGAKVLLGDIPHKGGRTFGIRVEADGASFAYLPDHDPSADADPGAALAHGVDVLLHDAQFDDDERSIAVAYGHSTVSDAIALADRADVGQLVLIHHSPGRTDEAVHDLAARHAARTGIPVTIGCQGDVLEL